MTGSHSLYKDGWKASFPHDRTKRIPASEERWYLYNVREDFNEQNDLAAKYPEKVKELAEAFEAEAWKYNVYPLKDDWAVNNQTAFGNAKKIVLYKGNFLSRSATPKFYNDSYSITANAEVTSTTQGVLFSFGNALSGISLYVKDKKLAFAYNADGKLIEVKSEKEIPAGKVSLKAEVSYSNNGKNKAVSLFINGQQVGSRNLGTISNASSGDDGLEVGRDLGTTVTTSYRAPFEFSGKINEVVLELIETPKPVSYTHLTLPTTERV